MRPATRALPKRDQQSAAHAVRQFHALGAEVIGDVRAAGDIGAGSRQALDQRETDRIIDRGEDNLDRGGCRLRGKGSRAGGFDYHVDLQLHRLRQQRGKPTATARETRALRNEQRKCTTITP